MIAVERWMTLHYCECSSVRHRDDFGIVFADAADQLEKKIYELLLFRSSIEVSLRRVGMQIPLS